MTEAEANEKQCCGPEGCGMQNDRPFPARWCVGSVCMAWRWAGYRAENGDWVRKTASGPWDPLKAEGYCGLAGSPA